MRRILLRLFGPVKLPEGHSGTSLRSRPSVTIPMPEGLDPEATRRVPLSGPDADPATVAQQMAIKNAKLFAFEMGRAKAAGCTAYIWRTAGDADVCEVCRTREGVRFFYADGPEHGHAGICRACPQGWCRCYAEPIPPGI